jgi:hypothetical protein
MNINKLRYYFVYLGREYVFREKKLFQQPYQNNGRYFSEREIKYKANGYYLQKKYVSYKYIKTILLKKEFVEKVESELVF